MAHVVCVALTFFPQPILITTTTIDAQGGVRQCLGLGLVQDLGLPTLQSNLQRPSFASRRGTGNPGASASGVVSVATAVTIGTNAPRTTHGENNTLQCARNASRKRTRRELQWRVYRRAPNDTRTDAIPSQAALETTKDKSCATTTMVEFQ
jgi:hypothetical protein